MKHNADIIKKSMVENSQNSDTDEVDVAAAG